jgi:hypothetical protein
VLLVGGYAARADNSCDLLSLKIVKDQVLLDAAKQVNAPQGKIDAIQKQLDAELTDFKTQCQGPAHELICHNLALAIQQDELAILDAETNMAPQGRIDALKKQEAKDQAAFDAEGCST